MRGFVKRQALESYQLILTAMSSLSACNPLAFFEKGEEERSFGLRSPNYESSGGRSSEIPIPVDDHGNQKDPHDRDLDRQDRDHLRGFREIAAQAERQRQRETARGIVYPTDADRTCANCGFDSERLRVGRCEPCYGYRYKYGIERPRRLWTIEDAS